MDRTVSRTGVSVLKNDLCDRLLLGVRNGEGHVFDAELCSEFSRLAVERHRRTPSRHTHDFTVTPPHAVVPSCTERLHRRFFRGEASGVTLDAVGLRIAVANLARGEDALEKAAAETLDRLADARNLSDVDPGANDHKRLPIQRELRVRIIDPRDKSICPDPADLPR